MSNCCNCIYQISGCYNVCADILLALEGIENGTYTVNAGYYSFSAIASDGVLTIPAGTLNENDCQELQIEGYTLTVDDKSYDCFKIKTIYQLTASSFDTNTGGLTPEPSEDFCTKVQQCMENFANADLTFTGDRAHNLDGNSMVIRETGVHSLQLGADLPAGMIPTPDIKFSGFTGSNTSDSIMSFNGSILNDGILYKPYAAILQGEPFNSNGSLVDYGLYYEDDGIGEYDLSYKVGWFSDKNSLLQAFELSFRNGDFGIYDNINNVQKWQLGKDGSLTHDGAYANKPYRYTAGGSHIIPDNVSVYIYDPASVQAGATITLPANPLDGQDLYIIGGGTITTGNVITGFTLNGNGRTVIGDVASALKVGKAYELHYCGENNIWYAIAF